MKAWLYYRLSRDEDEEMNSLQNQRQILIDYAKQNGYEVIGESFDDNVSGMTFDRKGLNELENAVDEGKIEAVLVKDLSRLGRHRTQTALFIDHLRENNVKVISVTEGIDTTNENDDLLIGFKQIFNDFYAKDIGKKVRAGIRQKQKTGLVVNLPMGYYKDKNTGEVLIDETAAEIIREVFQRYIGGHGITAIARNFNNRGIKSPEYFSHRKISSTRTEMCKKFLWTQTAVKRLLQNESYTGTLVNHKTSISKIYHTRKEIPDEDRYRHEDFLPMIIDKQTWEQAQFLLEQRPKSNVRAGRGRIIHRYSGLIRCGDCGAILIAKRRTWQGKEYVEYTCNSHHRYGKQYCTPHRIHQSQLDEIVNKQLIYIRDKVVAESEQYEQIIKEWVKKKPLYEQNIRRYTEKIAALKNQIEDLIMGKVTDRSRAEYYDNMIEKRENEIAELEQKISDSQQYNEISRQKRDSLKSTSELLSEIISSGYVSDANLRMLLKEVKVFNDEDGGIDVVLEFNGDFDRQ